MHTLTAEKILAEALPHGIVVLDDQDQILWCNTVACQLLQLSKNPLTNIKNVFNDNEFATFIDKKEQSALEIYAPNNQNIRLSIHRGSYLADQQLLIIQDITHLYRLEKMRQDFVANVSHELRTPLTVFRGYLETLLDQTQVDPKQLKQILQQMADQNQRMERLVEDLLLLSRLESVEPDFGKHQLVDVPMLLRQIRAEAESLSGTHQHEIHLDIDENLKIFGELHELHSAFSNIVVNAIRYTPAHGKILIKWYQDKKGAHFEVTDTGIGIEPKHIDRITQRFYRVDKARSRAQGGTGLGLAIVKHVLLRHGGDLAIESVLNRGSTFRCTFSPRG